jgi:hypothetical protein
MYDFAQEWRRLGNLWGSRLAAERRGQLVPWFGRSGRIGLPAPGWSGPLKGRCEPEGGLGRDVEEFPTKPSGSSPTDSLGRV